MVYLLKVIFSFAVIYTGPHKIKLIYEENLYYNGDPRDLL